MKGLSGIPKKCYRYTLAAIFINIIFGNQLNDGQKVNSLIAQRILDNPKEFTNFNLQDIKGTVEQSMKAKHFYNPTDYETVDKCIRFFRERIKSIKTKQASLFKASELSEILDVQKIFEQVIKPHHWLDFNLNDGLIPTVPEFIAYGDVVNLWNDLIEKAELYQEEEKQPINDFERYNSKSNRLVRYQLGTLMRTTWIAAVTFAECYLYYIFYNLSNDNYPLHNQASKDLLGAKKIEDEEIVERILFLEFSDISSNHKIKKLYKDYKEINNKRNRFIHPSAFNDKSQNISLLQTILNTNTGEVRDAVIVCTKLVKEIDDNLPDELRILFWWEKITHPDYENYKVGSIVNPNKRLKNND